MISASHEPQMGLTFEQVWAALMEDREQIREMRKENDRVMKETSDQIKEIQKETALRRKETEKAVKETFEQIKEMQKKTALQMEETQKKTALQLEETDRHIKRMSKTLGGLGNSLGQLIETLIAARLWEKFDVYKYNLKRSYQRVTLYDENNEELTEIDILLSNGEYVMAVEVKENFHRLDEVDHHLKRMELIKKYPPAECKGKKLLGAVAGGIVTKDAKDYAHKAGFFVLELTGESVQIAKAPAGFTPRQW